VTRELFDAHPGAAPQPEGLEWPTKGWPFGEASSEVRSAVERAFTDPALSITQAVVVVQGGRIVTERYDGELTFFDREPEPVSADTALLSWSMAKSMTHFLVGLLVDDGRLDPAAPAPVEEWSGPGDPRRAITLGDLLAMRDGLDFVEDYVDDRISNVIEMLYGDGRDDTAGYAAARGLKNPPGEVFNYSSGTTNIISRIVANIVGPGEPYRTFISERLFDPIGMHSAHATFDAAGTFVGSSYVKATARDFAKFGYLYLRGGTWDSRPLVSRDWVDTAQRPLSYDPEAETYYSWQWWVVGDDYGSYCASGYEGQRIVVVPALDAVIVRLGKTPATNYPDLRAWLRELTATLAH